MTQPEFPIVGDGTFLEQDQRLHPEELQLAFRNKALPLEALRYDITPTGLHYTLTHFDIPAADAASWRLTVGGQVRAPLSLSLDDLQRRAKRTLRVLLECAGDGRAMLSPRPISQPWVSGAIGVAEWGGTPLRALLEEAGLAASTVDIVFTGLDHGIEGGIEQDYQRGLPLQAALEENVLLAWEMNGAPLEPQHGYPLRLIVPGWYGMAHVKWLSAIEAVSQPFEGYQHTAYRYAQTRNGPGEPVSLIRVRSLMIPPGIPDYLTRTRVAQRGRIEIEGRAWSGRAAISSVVISVDGGASWEGAELEPREYAYGWQRWRYTWEGAAPGTYDLCCRATNEAGETQPLEQHWTARGMGNNMAQRVRVLVR